MPTFVALLSFTEQGIREFKGTTKRADNFTKAAKKAGVTVKEIYWTIGRYDGLLILEAADGAAVAAALISLGALGNVRTQTLRAFNRKEIESILANVP